MIEPNTVLGVIPARAGASRFPNKILAPILGKPMIVRVWERASQAKSLGRVIVATDSLAAKECISQAGGEAVLTPGEFVSGTDRVAFVARDTRADIIVNIQGDEPLLDPACLDALVTRLQQDPSLPMATLAIRRRDEQDLRNPHIVKVVTNPQGEALYFSRQPLAVSPEGDFLKHIGIYAYRREALLRLCELPPSVLETTERLEQLRALENGYRIAVCLIDFDTVAVDIPSDILRVEKVLEGRS